MGKIVNIDGVTLNQQDDGVITDTFDFVQDLGGGKVKLTHTQNVTDILQYAYNSRQGGHTPKRGGDMRQIAVVPSVVFALFPEMDGDLKAFKKWLFKEKLEGRDWSTAPVGGK